MVNLLDINTTISRTISNPFNNIIFNKETELDKKFADVVKNVRYIDKTIK